MVVMHKFLGSTPELAELLKKALLHSETAAIVDLCSGSGGPMLEVYQLLKAESGVGPVRLTLTDLYPNMELAALVNGRSEPTLHYETRPIDAARVSPELRGVRTMVGSFHHMPPAVATSILRDAKENNQPICIYEISDNSFPIMLWWIALPLNFIMALFITPFARPLTFRQLFFTYILPVIPFFFAWDGAVSNARTYTLSDMDVLLEGLASDDYTWETGLIPGKAKKPYLLGLPKVR
ncbi:hypothetical protein GCM10022409_16860 [Hymenobacter glaciei]|uniref:Class I SAM-dependent methyltransferase n=2 Tax=Hymenobacter glaciei TaxID=877209 RepID=A0ABP7TYX5_9BACT